MSNVIPIRDPWDNANKLIESMDRLIGGIPEDGLAEGFLLQPDSRAEMQRAAAHLMDAYHLLRRVHARENPRYNAYITVLGTEGVRT